MRNLQQSHYHTLNLQQQHITYILNKGPAGCALTQPLLQGPLQVGMLCHPQALLHPAQARKLRALPKLPSMWVSRQTCS